MNRTITIEELLRSIQANSVSVTGNEALAGVTHDSRRVGPGMVFVAIPGDKFDGHDFIETALKKGAALVIGSDAKALEKAPNHLVVDNPRLSMAIAANVVYRHPTRTLPLVGFTGTNGKTTSCYICEEMAKAAGLQPGVIGTVNARFAGTQRALPHTTPEAPVMCQIMTDMIARRVSVLFAEISSHALALNRVAGMDPQVGVFTNLSQDHLDFHKDMTDYEAVKTGMFTDWLRASQQRRGAVVNLDDDAGIRIAKKIDYDCVTYGIDNAHTTIQASEIQGNLDGQQFVVTGPFGRKTVKTRLVGRHNVYNILSAIGVFQVMGWDLEQGIAGLETLNAVPGRLESIDNSFGFGVWVDYAHSPDSLLKAQEALRPVVPGRMITVFGAGGDRDRNKRPKMAAAVEQVSDIAVVTSDNPRTETPGEIVAEVLTGLSQNYRDQQAVVATDRARAIETAISLARRGDGVLIAGKGHEDYQIVGNQVLHFDDREHARKTISVLEELRR